MVCPLIGRRWARQLIVTAPFGVVDDNHHQSTSSNMSRAEELGCPGVTHMPYNDNLVHCFGNRTSFSYPESKLVIRETEGLWQTPWRFGGDFGRYITLSLSSRPTAPIYPPLRVSIMLCDGPVKRGVHRCVVCPWWVRAAVRA